MGQSLAPSTAPVVVAAPRKGAATAEVVVPDISTAKASDPLPVVQPRPAFVLAWHPERWMVHAGRVVPDLRKVRLSPGISGVQQSRARVGEKGRIMFAHAKARLEQRGFTVLPHELGPDGSYVRRVWVDPTGRGQSRRPHYCTPWESYFPGSSQVVSDEEGYAEWLHSLVTQGHIPACPPHILAKLGEKARGRLERLEDRVAKGITAAAPAARAAKAELVVLEGELDGRIQSTAPVRPDDEAIIPELT